MMMDRGVMVVYRAEYVMRSGGQSVEKSAGNETMKIAENLMGCHTVAGTTLS